MKRSRPLVLFLLLLSFGCAAFRKPAEPVHVVIVGTTDVHGWFNGHVETPPGGGEGVLWGGLPVLATHVEALREEHDGRVLLVDSGDMFQGTLESNLFEGEAVVRGYNALGYTAAAAYPMTLYPRTTASPSNRFDSNVPWNMSPESTTTTRPPFSARSAST